MDKNINIAPKEIAPGVFSTGGTATMPTVNPIQPNVITPQALQPVAPINLAGTTPAPTVDTSLVANATQGTQAFDTNAEFQRQLDLQKQTTPDQTPLNDILASLTASEQGLTGRGTEQLNAETTAGIPEAQKTRATLQGTIKSQLAEYEALKTEFEKMSADIEAGAGRKGLTTGAVMGQQGAVDRAKLARLNSKASEIGLLQAQDQALAGQIETAQNTVNRAIDLRYQDREAEYQIKKLQYDRIKDNLTAEEKKRGEALQNALKKEETALAEKKQNEKEVENMLIQAQVNQAPLSVLNKAQALAKNGASKVEIAKALGTYTMSQADKLELELKKAQINSANASAASSNRANRATTIPDAPTIKTINGKDMQWNGTAWVEPSTTGAGVGNQTAMVAERGLDKLKQTKDLVSNTKGLNASAGAVKGSGLLYLQNTKDWRAGAINLMSKLTIDELGRIKADGVTFGALSDPEREAVGASASILNAGSVKDKNGNPTGKFNISESKVKQAIEDIAKYQELDFIYRTGMTPAEYEAQQYLNQTEQALQNTNGAYSTYQ